MLFSESEFSKHLSPASTLNVKRWLSEPLYAEYKEELEAMIEAGRWGELEDAFFKVIEFGTGGRRGATGIGSNRINKVTIGESAQALCEYAKSFDDQATKKGIAIACDTRLSSPELSRFAAQICAANGFKTYLFEDFRSTPELSFTVRRLGCAAGIVISASHNPPADNGFKAYWYDGGQLVSPHDKGVMSLVDNVNELQISDFDEAVAEGSIVLIGADIDQEYISAVISEAMGETRDIKIVYSPLHGAGQTNTLPVLRAAGFERVSVVELQMTPDGNFPTIENNKANPEERVANDLAVAQMMVEGADIAITNDPDADRIGVMVRQGEEPVYLNGNQSAVLAADHVLSHLAEKSDLDSRHYLAKTIVTTDMLIALADYYGITTYDDMLIGFKYIGKLLLDKENTDEIFTIGGEESYGLLKGTYARDKDGAVGALLLAESAAELKAAGKTLFDRLLELFERHGVFVERLDTVPCPGANGFTMMQAIMQKLRSDPPASIGNTPVTAILDYLTLERRQLDNDITTNIVCTSGNVIALELGDRRCRITIRPSGTEPKLKFYTQWYEAAQTDVSLQYAHLTDFIEGLSKELEGLVLSQNL